MAAYRAWHEAMALRGAGLSGLDFADYRALLQKAIDLDPTFTRPLAELLGNYALAVWYNKNPEIIAMVEDLLEQIRDLAPGSVDFLIAQTFYTYYVLNDYDLAHQIVTRALERAPSDTELMRIKSWIERRRGDYDAYIETLRLARKLDPRQPAYTAGIARALFLHHRYAEAKNDLGRLAADIETAIEGNRDMMANVDLWWFRFINRDFEGAAEANKMLPGNGYFDLQSEVVLSPRGFSRLSDIAFFGKEAGDDEFLAEVKATITEHSTEEQRNGGGATFAMAMVAAAEGNVDNMRKHIHDWHGGRGSDWTERTLNLDFTCQLFGVVGDAQSAVACIRDGLEGPSMVVPWFETLNPYYDPIRETPEFMELVEELNRETSTRR
jgi:tetratricopeptide (TPR) repeat protein